MRISVWSSDVCSSDLLAKPSFRFGLAEIRVSDHENDLAVSIRPDKQDYQVRGEASVAIEVKLPDGQPAAYGTVAFAAVDRALLRAEEGRVGKGCVRTCRSRGGANT